MRFKLVFPLSLVFLEIGTYLANDMYLPGLPTISDQLGISQDQAQYTLLVWFLGSGSFQLLTGPISDSVGRRVVLLSGAILFCLSSLVCAITSNLMLLLIARFVQGSAICAIVVPGYAAVHEYFDTQAAIKIIAIMGSVTILAPAFGPLLGAIVIEVSHWRAIFWTLTIWGLIAFLILFFVMPETNQNPHPIKLKQIFKDYFRISTRWHFLKYTLTFCFLFLAFICWIVESPFIIIETRGYSRLEFGIIQFLIFVWFIIGSQLTRILIDRMSVFKTIEMGLLTACFGALFLATLVHFEMDSLYAVVIAMMVISFGAAIAFGPLNRCAIESAKEPMGRRTAMQSTFMGIFGVIGIMLVTFFNDKTLDNVSYLVVLGVLSAIAIYKGMNFFEKHE